MVTFLSRQNGVTARDGFPLNATWIHEAVELTRCRVALMTHAQKAYDEFITSSLARNAAIYSIISAANERAFLVAQGVLSSPCGARAATHHRRAVVPNIRSNIPQVWDAKTTENLHTFHPALSIGSHTEASVHTVCPLPGLTEQVLVSNRTSTAFLCTLQGQVVRSFTSPKVRNAPGVTCNNNQARGNPLASRAAAPRRGHDLDRVLCLVC